MSKRILFLFGILGIAGLLDALYLTASHYATASLSCSVFNGCDAVTSSSYSMWGNVPVAVMGVVYYALILFLTALAIWKDKRYFLFAAGATIFGFFASLWFVYLQFFVLRALCTYCLASAAVSFILFGVSIFSFLEEKKRGNKHIAS